MVAYAEAALTAILPDLVNEIAKVVEAMPSIVQISPAHVAGNGPARIASSIRAIALDMPVSNL